MFVFSSERCVWCIAHNTSRRIAKHQHDNNYITHNNRKLHRADYDDLGDTEFMRRYGTLYLRYDPKVISFGFWLEFMIFISVVCLVFDMPFRTTVSVLGSPDVAKESCVRDHPASTEWPGTQPYDFEELNAVLVHVCSFPGTTAAHSAVRGK